MCEATASHNVGTPSWWAATHATFFSKQHLRLPCSHTSSLTRGGPGEQWLVHNSHQYFDTYPPSGPCAAATTRRTS